MKTLFKLTLLSALLALSLWLAHARPDTPWAISDNFSSEQHVLWVLLFDSRSDATKVLYFLAPNNAVKNGNGPFSEMHTI